MLLSSPRCPSNASSAAPSPVFDAATRLTYVPFGTPGTFDATFFHVFPPPRVTCTLPSSVPTHSTFGANGDSLSVVMVGYSCTPSCRDKVFLSGVFPKICSLLRSTPVVSSPPSLVQLSPRSVDLKR